MAKPRSRSRFWFNLFAAAVLMVVYLYFEPIENSPEVTPEITPEPVVTDTPVLGLSTIEGCEVFFTNPTGTPVNVRNPEEGIIELINEAKETIDMAAFEFDLVSMKDALAKAWWRGVKIRVVYDGEYVNKDKHISELLSLGITGIADERSGLMHNKFLIVDRRIVWTGSFNFTENAAHKNNENAVRIESPELAKAYEEEFLRMFGGDFGPKKEDVFYPSMSLCGSVGEVYFAPDGPKEAILEVIGDAHTSIHVMAFSFTDDDMGDVLVTKSKSGLDVGAIFETTGSDTQYSELSEIGLSATGCQDATKGTFHHKVMVVDGKVVVFGSYNFSSSAEEDNDENILIIKSPAIAQKFEEEYQRRFQEALSSGLCTVN